VNKISLAGEQDDIADGQDLITHVAEAGIEQELAWSRASHGDERAFRVDPLDLLEHLFSEVLVVTDENRELAKPSRRQLLVGAETDAEPVTTSVVTHPHHLDTVQEFAMLVAKQVEHGSGVHNHLYPSDPRLIHGFDDFVNGQSQTMIYFLLSKYIDLCAPFMPSVKSKKTSAVKPMPAKSHPTKGRDGHGAHWHAVLWIAAIAITFSVSTISLAAMAQGATSGYQKNASGILQSISDIRKDVREIGARVMRIENSLAE
jgi:hypothetical protein